MTIAESDFKDAAMVMAIADQGGLGLPDRDYYFRDDAKSVELALINHGVRYRVPPARSRESPSELHIETPHGGVRLIIVDDAARRQRPRRDAQAGEEVRLSIESLRTLLNDT